MDTVASINEQTSARRNKAQARKDNTGQESVIELEPLKQRMSALVRLYGEANSAADAFNEAIKACAESAGLQASVVRKFVVARAGEKFEEKRRDVSQLSLLFDEIGE